MSVGVTMMTEAAAARYQLALSWGLVTGMVLGCQTRVDAAPVRTPAAIVEDITGRTEPGIMDYLYPGHRVALANGQRIVLGYLSSCLVEAITGGEVTVGVERSEVVGGIVQRRKVECMASRLLLSGEEAERSGGMLYRDPVQPRLTIFGLSPALSLTRPATVRLQRIDTPALPIEIDVTGLGADLARQGIVLTAGGIYRASIGERPILIFRVDPNATDHAPLVARLLRL
jgi:hypothetical protein